MKHYSELSAHPLIQPKLPGAEARLLKWFYCATLNVIPPELNRRNGSKSMLCVVLVRLRNQSKTYTFIQVSRLVTEKPFPDQQLGGTADECVAVWRSMLLALGIAQSDLDFPRSVRNFTFGFDPFSFSTFRCRGRRITPQPVAAHLLCEQYEGR